MQLVACTVINPPFLKQCHCTVSLNKSMSECKKVPMVGAEWHLAHSVLRICTDAQYLLVVTYHNWAESCIYVTHNTFHLRAFYNVGWLWCGRKQLCSTVCTTTVVVSRYWGKLNKLNQMCVCVYDMFYSTGTMLKGAAASDSNTSAPQRTVKAALSSLSVYDLHKRLINDYMVYYGKTTLLKRDM